MTLSTSKIGRILKHNGTVVITSSLTGPMEPDTNNLGSGHVKYLEKKMNLTVTDGTITLTRVSNDAADNEFNCVNIITNTNAACLGDVKIPGYVYTDSFSGCVFYLYRKDSNHVTGVHAHQGLDSVTQTIGSGIFKGMSISKDVRHEYGPQDYMLQRTKKQLCRHETRSVMTDLEKSQMCFLAFLSCVERHKATTYLYCYKSQQNGNKVGRLVETYVDRFI